MGNAHPKPPPTGACVLEIKGVDLEQALVKYPKDQGGGRCLGIVDQWKKVPRTVTMKSFVGETEISMYAESVVTRFDPKQLGSNAKDWASYDVAWQPKYSGMPAWARNGELSEFQLEYTTTIYSDATKSKKLATLTAVAKGERRKDPEYVGIATHENWIGFRGISYSLTIGEASITGSLKNLLGVGAAPQIMPITCSFDGKMQGLDQLAGEIGDWPEKNQTIRFACGEMLSCAWTFMRSHNVRTMTVNPTDGVDVSLAIFVASLLLRCVDPMNLKFVIQKHMEAKGEINPRPFKYI